jgi:PleD family two-component response regulator
MGRKGRYTILIPSLDDDYLAEGITSLIACKKYDETVTVINTTKGHEAWREQQLVNYNRTKRLLVVDDEYDTNLTLKVVLEESGFKVDSFTDPLAALQNFKTGVYDLALIDVRMPAMNGFGLYNEIRKLDIKSQNLFFDGS